MPTYLFQCQGECKQQFEVWSKIQDRNLPQVHCDSPATRLMNAPMVAPMFESFRAVGLPGKPWITSKAEHQAQLRDHGYEEVGNDSSMAPPKMSDQEFAWQQGEKLKQIEQSFKEPAPFVPDFTENSTY